MSENARRYGKLRERREQPDDGERAPTALADWLWRQLLPSAQAQSASSRDRGPDSRCVMGHFGFHIGLTEVNFPHPDESADMLALIGADANAAAQIIEANDRGDFTKAWDDLYVAIHGANRFGLDADCPREFASPPDNSLGIGDRVAAEAAVITACERARDKMTATNK